MGFFQKLNDSARSAIKSLTITSSRPGVSPASTYVNYLFFSNTPHWLALRDFQAYFDTFVRNPILYATIMIKGREAQNKRIGVRNKKTLEIEPKNTNKAIPRKCYQLISKPNPLQNTQEFFKQRKIIEQCCGNKLTYGNVPLGFKGMNIEKISTMWNVWPQFMQFRLTGKYFSATKVEDIIEGWRFEFNNWKVPFEPWEILHQNEPNVDVRDGLIFGRPAQHSMTRSLTNIELAYESLNVVMQERGMRFVISSDKGDASGRVALEPPEKKELKKAIKKYGLLGHQHQIFLTNQPVKVTPVDQDVRKLGLHESLATDAILVANGHGVPEILLQLSLEGSTYENQDAAVRRLYQGTLIPEDEDDMAGLNTWLGLDDTEWELVCTYDHIPFLQGNKKEEADSKKSKSAYMKELFMVGAVTHNEWLIEIGLKPYGPEGDKRIFEFTPEQIAIITAGKGQPKPNNEQQEEENQPPPPTGSRRNGKRIPVES